MAEGFRLLFIFRSNVCSSGSARGSFFINSGGYVYAFFVKSFIKGFGLEINFLKLKLIIIININIDYFFLLYFVCRRVVVKD